MWPNEIAKDHQYTSNYHNYHTRQLDNKIRTIPLCKSVKQQRHSVYRGSKLRNCIPKTYAIGHIIHSSNYINSSSFKHNFHCFPVEYTYLLHSNYAVFEKCCSFCYPCCYFIAMYVLKLFLRFFFSDWLMLWRCYVVTYMLWRCSLQSGCLWRFCTRCVAVCCKSCVFLLCVCVFPFAFLYDNHNPCISFLFVPV